MIEIKNTGKKLVNIGKTQLMPGESVKVSDKVADTPAIKAFEKTGILSLTEVKETTTTEKAASAAKTEKTTDVSAENTGETTATEKTAATTTKKTTSTAAKTTK